MNRRAFFKLAGVRSVAAGLILAPTLAENAEVARQFWALDRTMVPQGTWEILPNGYRIRTLWERDFPSVQRSALQWHDFLRDEFLNHRLAPSPYADMLLRVTRENGIVTLTAQLAAHA